MAAYRPEPEAHILDAIAILIAILVFRSVIYVAAALS